MRGQATLSPAPQSCPPSPLPPLVPLSGDPAVGVGGWRGLPLWHSEGARIISLSALELPSHGSDHSTLLLKINRQLHKTFQFVESVLRVLLLFCSLTSLLRLQIHGEKCHTTGKLCNSSHTTLGFQSSTLSVRFFCLKYSIPAFPSLLMLPQVVSSV